MRGIRFRYGFYHKKDTGIHFDYFSLEELENGDLKRRGYLESFFQILSRDISTGLMDKNGREIYEGDILGHCHPECRHPYASVVWNQSDCRWSTKQVGFLSDLPHDHLAKYGEVIGNVYENGGLLEGER